MPNLLESKKLLKDGKTLRMEFLKHLILVKMYLMVLRVFLEGLNENLILIKTYRSFLKLRINFFVVIKMTSN